jgi:hypothetical protein
VRDTIWSFRVKDDGSKKQGYATEDSLKYMRGLYESMNRMISLETARLLMFIAHHYRLTQRQFDFKYAYMNANMDVKLLIKISEGFHLIYQGDSKGKCLSLNRALYGAKKAGLLWYKLITKKFLELGFKQSLIEPCVFYSKEKNFRCIIALYIDDLRIVTDF